MSTELTPPQPAESFLSKLWAILKREPAITIGALGIFLDTLVALGLPVPESSIPYILMLISAVASIATRQQVSPIYWNVERRQGVRQG